MAPAAMPALLSPALVAARFEGKAPRLLYQCTGRGRQPYAANVMHNSPNGACADLFSTHVLGLRLGSVTAEEDGLPGLAHFFTSGAASLMGWGGRPDSCWNVIFHVPPSRLRRQVKLYWSHRSPFPPIFADTARRAAMGEPRRHISQPRHQFHLEQTAREPFDRSTSGAQRILPPQRTPTASITVPSESHPFLCIFGIGR
jgi:hypothetical protein